MVCVIHVDRYSAWLDACTHKLYMWMQKRYTHTKKRNMLLEICFSKKKEKQEERLYAINVVILYLYIVACELNHRSSWHRKEEEWWLFALILVGLALLLWAPLFNDIQSDRWCHDDRPGFLRRRIIGPLGLWEFAGLKLANRAGPASCVPVSHFFWVLITGTYFFLIYDETKKGPTLKETSHRLLYTRNYVRKKKSKRLVVLKRSKK
jgi:hypothetical protein